MIRLVCTAVVVATLAGGSLRSGAEPPPQALGSKAELEEARRLTATVFKLYREGRYRDAIGPAERSLSLRERALGPTHPEVATSLNHVARLYEHAGAYAKAEALYVRALRIREEALGPTHLQVASILNNLALLYQEQGAYAKAAPLLARALAISEKALGPMHPKVATSLNNVARLYVDQGEYAKAEPLYARALAISEKALGPTHPNVSSILSNLAALYVHQGAYAKAEPVYARALAISEKALGPMHPNVSSILSNLAALYQDQGAYAKAEPLHVRALAIAEKVLGPTHPEVATNRNNLARLYQEQGAYGKAEPLFVRALTIREKALGPMHPAVATSLNGLAMLYHDQGAYAKAEPLYLRALTIREKALGPMHPDVATSLSNLARLYRDQGGYAKAEPLHVRALAIREKALGPMHPIVARSLNNLASVYDAQGIYAKAEPLYLRALTIREKALGPTHPAVATSLNNLAMLYQAQGAYEKAEPLHLRALRIRETALGPMHPDVATSLNNLAVLHMGWGSDTRALLLESRAAQVRERGLLAELARLSEQRKRALMRRLQGETYGFVSLHADRMPNNLDALDLAMTTVLRRKGRTLDSLVENETTLRAHLTPSLRAQFDRLARARSELVARLYASAGPRTIAARKAIDATRARIDELESELSAASAEFRVRTEPVTVAKIQAAQPQGAALVEFVRYRRFDAKSRQQRWQEERYVAYLLTSGGPPQWVALGPAAPIDAEVVAVLAAMDREIAAGTAKRALRRLDALLFAPVRSRLTNVSHVILAPDSTLNLVPFEALVDAQGHYALEHYLVSYVTTGRDLLRLGIRRRPRSPPMIVAGPDYGPVSTPSRPGSASFRPLAGALLEATDLRPYFSTAPWTGRKATKSAVTALTGPAILHVATHGFYARDAWATARTEWSVALAQEDRERGISVEEGSTSVTLPPRSDDPADALDRSGLALAGANQGANGILTAREIAGLDWWGTQLVVLSACETGVGAVPSGEGVIGLRRALVLAGTESQVITLWSVGDSTTRELMRDFYGELARGTGRAEALRQAKIRLMRQPGRAHPYYWAAFIPAGDWRPLDKRLFSFR